MEKRVEKEIKILAERVLKQNGFTGKPVREHIFEILRKEAKVIMFPLPEEEGLDGFHVERVVDGEIRAFVYINSAKYFEKNIFCAAHELGHTEKIDDQIETAIGIKSGSFSDDDVDEIMNRFAAELLMPEQDFKEQTKVAFDIFFKDRNNSTQAELLSVIVYLMDHYYVPYKAVVMRLYEVGILTDKGLKAFVELESVSPELISEYISKGNYINLHNSRQVKQFDGLIENIQFAESNDILPEETVQYLKEEFGITYASDKVSRDVMNASISEDIKQED